MQLSRATACRDSSVTIRLTAVMRKVLAISQQHASKGVYFINTIIYVSNCPTQFQNDRMFFTSKNSHIHMLLFFFNIRKYTLQIAPCVLFEIYHWMYAQQ